MSNSAILCVDDEVAILNSLKQQLKKRFGNRYIYEVAENVEEPWMIIDELLEDEINIIVIVSDWLMHGIKGDEFLIQVHEKSPQLVRIMLTGQADSEAVARAKKQANLPACLYKPWTEEQLTNIINSALGG